MNVDVKHKLRKGRRGLGFTIVELLIVVVVIGILAAIVIVAYNGITKQATDSAVRSDLAQVAKKLELFKAEKGRYPISKDELLAAKLKINRNHYRLTNTDGTPRNNFYYIVANSNHSDGLGSHYAIGTIPLNAATSTICLKDSAIIIANCSGGDATRLLISAASSTDVELAKTDTSWPSTGYSSTEGWQDWTDQ